MVFGRIGVMYLVACMAAGCLPKRDDDTASTRSDSGIPESPDGPVRSRLIGSYRLFVEGDCEVYWAMDGSGLPGQYFWEVSLDLQSYSCDAAQDATGWFELLNYSAYFDGSYIGLATYRYGEVEWETSGYITGYGGGSYAYMGDASYFDMQ